MSDIKEFTLPPPPQAGERFELLILTRLGQIAEAVAQIHQMVSPPDKPDEGEGLREIMLRMASALDQQTTVLEGLSEQVSRLERRGEEAAELK